MMKMEGKREVNIRNLQREKRLRLEKKLRNMETQSLFGDYTPSIQVCQNKQCDYKKKGFDKKKACGQPSLLPEDMMKKVIKIDLPRF